MLKLMAFIFGTGLLLAANAATCKMPGGSWKDSCETSPNHLRISSDNNNRCLIETRCLYNGNFADANVYYCNGNKVGNINGTLKVLDKYGDPTVMPSRCN